MLKLLVIFLKSKSKRTFLPSFTGLLWLVTLMCACIDTCIYYHVCMYRHIYLYCSCFFLSVEWIRTLVPHGSAHSVPDTCLGTPTVPCQASSIYSTDQGQHEGYVCWHHGTQA